MSDQPKNDQPRADQLNYAKPQVEVLGELRELTETILNAGLDDIDAGSQTG